MVKVPPFVRPMARRAVEKVARAEGLEEITAAEVLRAMPRRGAPKGQALADLVHEAEEMAEAAAVRHEGFELTVCGGLAGCPLAVGDTEAAYEGLRAVVSGLELGSTLTDRIDGPVLSHSRCKMTVCACPNGCSEPQIKDVALLAVAWPQCRADACTQCLACIKACPDDAVSVDAMGAHIDWSVCIGCGRCITACKDGGFALRVAGWDVLAGGRLGRHPRWADVMNGDPLPLDDALELARRVLEFLIERGDPGERLAAVLDRMGSGELRDFVRARA